MCTKDWWIFVITEVAGRVLNESHDRNEKPYMASISSNYGVALYLPIQNLLKITPSRSSELNSPVIEFN